MFSARDIPAPHLKAVMCAPPMWLRTQAGRTDWLGNCVGQLPTPPARISLTRGTVFAVGCVPRACRVLPALRSSAAAVVAFRGRVGGADYFETVGPGAATIWAASTRRGRAPCEVLVPSSLNPNLCPALTVEVVRGS